MFEVFILIDNKNLQNKIDNACIDFPDDMEFGFDNKKGYSEKQILAFEEKLGIELPKTYAEFMNLYGYAYINGLELLPLEGEVNVMSETNHLREEYGIKNMIVIAYDTDDTFYCLDIDEETNEGKTLVVMIDGNDIHNYTQGKTDSPIKQVLADNFEAFIEKIIDHEVDFLKNDVEEI